MYLRTMIYVVVCIFFRNTVQDQMVIKKNFSLAELTNNTSYLPITKKNILILLCCVCGIYKYNSNSSDLKQKKKSGVIQRRCIITKDIKLVQCQQICFCVMNEMEVEEESRPILTQKGMTNVSLSIRFIMSHFDLSYILYI